MVEILMNFQNIYKLDNSLIYRNYMIVLICEEFQEETKKQKEKKMFWVKGKQRFK